MPDPKKHPACTRCGATLTLTLAHVSFVELDGKNLPGLRARAFDMHHPEPVCELWQSPRRVECLPLEWCAEDAAQGD